jgi:hypothetical protein
MTQSDSGAQISQILLRLQYQDMVRRSVELPRFADVEFRSYSQNCEDGILLYIFSVIGTTNRRVVEICAGDGVECNAANLIVNHGWRGLLFDGDANAVEHGRAFYAACRTTFVAPPTLVHAWITTENINRLIEENGFSGPVDLFSLDIDGNDYWIWKAIDTIQPRAVVLEFNAACGPEDSIAMSYNPEYRLDIEDRPYRCGASLPAFVKLGRSKGYRLVGIHSLGFNAFFVRNGVADDLLPEQSPRQCYEENDRLRPWTSAWKEAIVSGPELWEPV